MERVKQIFVFAVICFLSIVAVADNHGSGLNLNVVLTRDLSLPGSQLCHDGLYVYYNSRQSCLEANKFQGCDSLKLVPLHQVERVYLTEEDFVTQFHKIDLGYGSSQKVKLCSECKDKDCSKTQNILSERWASDDEWPYLYVLLKNNMSVVNSPMGPITSLRRVNVDSYKLSSVPALYKRYIRSPMCDDVPLFIDYVMKLGGEYSGNGWRKANMEYLQDSSGELKTSKSIENIDDLLDAEISCVRTIEI